MLDLLIFTARQHSLLRRALY